MVEEQTHGSKADEVPGVTADSRRQPTHDGRNIGIQLQNRGKRERMESGLRGRQAASEGGSPPALDQNTIRL